MSNTPEFKTFQDVIDYYTKIIGDPDAVFAPPSGRPYILIARKGTAKLLMNVAIEGMEYNGERIQGALIRFFQIGGIDGAYSTVLKTREAVPEHKIFRLSKVAFALCKVHAEINPLSIWKQEGVTDKLLGWVKNVCQIENATQIEDGIIKQVIEMSLPDMTEPYPENPVLFNVDVHVIEGGTPVKAVPVATVHGNKLLN